MTVSVQLGDLLFLGDGSDPNWIYRSLAGWYSGAPIRGNSEDYPNADGQSPIDVAYRSARPLRFRGYLFADTSADAITRWMEFAALQSDGSPFPLTVVDPLGIPLSCVVSVNGVPEVLELTNEGAEVVVPMVAYDPVKYSAPRLTSTGLPTAGGGLEYPLHGPAGALSYGVNGTLGRVSLTNSGTALVWPSVTVSGGLTAGFTVQRLDTGQLVRYDRVVPVGSTVMIDFRTGEVLIDGTSDGSTYLTSYDFFSLAPQSSVEVQFNAIAGSTGTPLAVFSNSDGYW